MYCRWRALGKKTEIWCCEHIIVKFAYWSHSEEFPCSRWLGRINCVLIPFSCVSASGSTSNLDHSFGWKKVTEPSDQHGLSRHRFSGALGTSGKTLGETCTCTSTAQKGNQSHEKCNGIFFTVPFLQGADFSQEPHMPVPKRYVVFRLISFPIFCLFHTF